MFLGAKQVILYIFSLIFKIFFMVCRFIAQSAVLRLLFQDVQIQKIKQFFDVSKFCVNFGIWNRPEIQ